MSIIESQINTSSEIYLASREVMLEELERVRALEQQVRARSNSRKLDFEKRGQQLPRERIALLLDRGSPWLELSPLAGLGMHDDDGNKEVLGGGLIAGIGYISGVRCVIKASDSAIKGGTVAPMGQRKNLRAQEIALTNKLPLVTLVESGGANLRYQSEIFVGGGRSFYNQARLSAAGIPQITVVHGSCTAGGAYLPGLSDVTIMVQERAKVFLAGPPLLKAATGEIATDEELGGADMHATLSGVADYLARNDTDGVRIAREVLDKSGWPRTSSVVETRDYREPLYDPDELAGTVPWDYRKPYDVREVIARIADGSEFLDFKPLYGALTVCGQASVHGYRCAFIGNNGPIDVQGATKASQFIQLMCQSGVPIIYLQNTTGFMVGTAAEQAGIVKHGSKMIQAVANATVPQITINIGASFGAGNYGMCGRSFDPRFAFSWPNNRIAVMGGEQAAKVLEIVTREKHRRRGTPVDEDDVAAAGRQLIEQFDRESTALFATARLWDDGIIDPRDTRKILGYCLSICHEEAGRTPNSITFGVPRH
ncbi:MAG: acyl-CoA carboxylase subunit beta [Ectothiorhodospiraceae bacterium]|nr:acyl-CoA carboxylase subunit beta [Ectothiorhodospiraceae bacterium]